MLPNVKAYNIHMKTKKEKPVKPERMRKKSFKKRFDEAIERDLKSRYTEMDGEFLEKLKSIIDENIKN